MALVTIMTIEERFDPEVSMTVPGTMFGSIALSEEAKSSSDEGHLALVRELAAWLRPHVAILPVPVTDARALVECEGRDVHVDLVDLKL